MKKKILNEGNEYMRILHTRSVSFNFLNETKMIIILNKWDEIGMKATRPKLVLLSFLNIVNLFDKYLF